jgi:hypothetical protein
MNIDCLHDVSQRLKKIQSPAPDDLEPLMIKIILVKQIPEGLWNGEAARQGAIIGISLGLLELNVSKKGVNVIWN